VPEFPQPLSEGIEVGGVQRRGYRLQHANAIDLLRLSAERRGEEAASHSAEEGPSIHYSIT
jgi:NOL1/NOP2/fmu family ribosome biogenesis protein